MIKFNQLRNIIVLIYFQAEKKKYFSKTIRKIRFPEIIVMFVFYKNQDIILATS